MLTLNDGRAELWQWDTGRTLAVDADCSQVHFSNKVFGRSIDVDVIGGSAIIPDVLLQTDKDLNVWAFVGTAENGYTKISKTFNVNRRNKPADYVFTPTEQMTLQMIQRQIGDLADLTTEAKDTLVAAINEAARTGGGAGSMDLRVADGYIQYSTDGGRTWKNLIAMADLKGDPGTAGKDGHSPVVTATKSGKTTTISVDGTAIATVEDGADGAPGSRGADGITPTIGSNGNWYLGETDTGKPSRGETGPAGADGKDGAGMDIAGATVGQIAKITAVDDTGKPTAWEAVDMPSGGGGASYRSWSKVWTLAVAEDIAGFTASDIDLDGKSEIMIVFISDSTASRTMTNGRLIINGVDAGKALFNTLPLKKDSHSFVIIGRADVGIEYTTMQATAEYQTYPWQGEVKIVHRMVSGTGSIIQWTAGSTIEITQASATLGQGVTIEIYVR